MALTASALSSRAPGGDAGAAACSAVSRPLHRPSPLLDLPALQRPWWTSLARNDRPLLGGTSEVVGRRLHWAAVLVSAPMLRPLRPRPSPRGCRLALLRIFPTHPVFVVADLDLHPSTSGARGGHVHHPHLSFACLAADDAPTLDLARAKP
jgi:hypothetical protein